ELASSCHMLRKGPVNSSACGARKSASLEIGCNVTVYCNSSGRCPGCVISRRKWKFPLPGTPVEEMVRSLNQRLPSNVVRPIPRHLTALKGERPEAWMCITTDDNLLIWP